ncbi:phage shock protein operon transcriptional activator [Agarivorans sp. 1_MG-2023]|uniref:phage shock protein operon transcriptional activator n=1 Tax=Agarivorans sp. 1_MG-2023 TaxID=3062634 RepID=UPI0026E3697C|nr:phage shock protein operon transcriptional activator [Agarivorans sp. 1_MG-2023]MDO6764038.1 phage shock protein operon transcriptional activator [Agarivorans sp. 1_MG-2023]
MNSPSLLGNAPSFLEVLDKVSLLAPLNRPVLVIGERGTGKELIAARLHYLSERWDKHYLSLNCASLNPNLIESELFGHQAGAFTGAAQQRIGRFEQADKGSLFLDELANMPSEVQEKLLRTIEYNQIERLGSNKTIDVDVRLICATNQDLPSLVTQGKFRADLLDRLSFAVITLPPLRHRAEDICLLAEHFAQKIAHELNLNNRVSFTTPVKQQLEAYSWPGNIRELKNVVERAVVENSNAKGQVEAINVDPFASPWRPVAEPNNESQVVHSHLGFTQQVAEFEKKLIIDTLEKHHYKQTLCAQALEISYHQLRGLIKKHQINTQG